ncbi:hypothetical protein HK102_013631 [Quaeritorhiza haematococci]|nr:hypothetical protein HK102_013631 [Quaeritorhiza haematococci]
MDRDTTQISILASIWLFVLIGIPIWWRTTEVYRAPLPFEEIRRWSQPGSLDVDLTTHITLHVPSTSTPAEIDSLTTSVWSQLTTLFKDHQKEYTERNVALRNGNETTEGARANVGLRFEVGGKVRERMDGLWDALGDLDRKEEIQTPSADGNLNAYIACDNAAGEGRSDVYIGQYRNVYLKIGDCGKDTISRHVVALVAGLFSDEQKEYQKLLENLSTKLKNKDHESMRTLKYASQYQVTFSLLNGDPGTLLVDWDVEGGIDGEHKAPRSIYDMIDVSNLSEFVAYFEPFLAAVSNISDFKIDSQILHYTTLPIVPDRLLQGDKVIHYLRPKSLSHFINSAEWNLASVISTGQPINFILYVPPESQRPLHLMRSNGEFLPSNAFLIPQWGGIVVSNPTTTPAPNSLPRTHKYTSDELKSVMEIFIAQLRSLVGVKKVEPQSSITYATSDVGITLLELDRLTRKITVRNMVDAVTTLNSLARLIEDMENMVVEDTIQRQVLDALDALEKAHKSLTHHDIRTAHAHARKALLLAESAFFDPTMVSLLYFPDEHKYAVYMPLFIPISVPLIVAVIKELRKWKLKRAAGKVKKE